MVPAPSPPDFAQLSLGDLIAVASAQPVLDEQAEDSLLERAREGDLEAREMLVMGNLRVAIDEAIRMRGGLPQRQLMPAGVRSLLEAIRTYDPALHGPFASHVRSRVRRVLRASITVS